MARVAVPRLLHWKTLCVIFAELLKYSYKFKMCISTVVVTLQRYPPPQVSEKSLLLLSPITSIKKKTKKTMVWESSLSV